MPGMGENTPKTELDQAYRKLVTAFLEEIMERRKINKTELAAALGVDRTVGSRYLSGKVRTPLHSLQFLDRTIRERVTREVEEAFWASKGTPETSTRKTG